jgi:putative addiction module component (TIGR02574 family)
MGDRTNCSVLATESLALYVFRMLRPLAEITEEALALPSESRAFLAEKLLETLDFEQDFPVSDAWRAEIRNRCDELDSGAVKTIPAETVLSEIRKSLA